MSEQIIETKTCKYCNASFEITDKDLEFYKKISPVFPQNWELKAENWENLHVSNKVIDLWNWKISYIIPTPTLCPDCRNQRRLSWRNEQNLYRRKCDATGKDIVSMYSPDKDLIVYDKEFWNTDKCDVMKDWNNLDLSKSFFTQFYELLYSTPIPSLTVSYESENSEYAIYSWKMKNCFMLFASWECESTMYSLWMIKTSHIIDCLDWSSLEKCYQVINSENCFWCIYTINSTNCQNCSFSYDLKNCSNCFLCYNLIWKNYCIENIEYSKDEYLEKIKELKNKTIGNWWIFFDDISKKAINKNLMMVQSENSIWDNLKSCKNCINCFHFGEAENCKYSQNWWMWCYNTYDGRWIWENLQFWYEVLDAWINAVTNCFLISCYTCNYTYYSINCHNSSHLFWCLWLKNKEYCILNKQYTKEEYEKLVPKIIWHMLDKWEWWEFFPSSISPFWYNETAAMEQFPMTREDVLKHDFNWSDYEHPLPKVDKIIHASMLPNDISKIPDDILNWAIECEVTKKPFRIVRQELEFYRKNDLPIPKRHPNQRHLDRVKLTNPKKIFDRTCDKCRKDIKTVYNPKDKKVVYCEECYNKEIY